MDPLVTAPVVAAAAAPKSSRSTSLHVASHKSQSSNDDQQQQRPRRKAKRPPPQQKGGSDNDTAAKQTRLESLTLHLSTLESNRSTKRQQLQNLFVQMQSIRNQMTDMEQELQSLDGEIENVEGTVRRLARSVEWEGEEGGSNTDQTQTSQYAATQLSPTQQRTQQHYEEGSVAAAAFVGHTQDVGTQDLLVADAEGEKEYRYHSHHLEEKKDAYDDDLVVGGKKNRSGGRAPSTPPSTMAPPDEMLTDSPLTSTTAAADASSSFARSGNDGSRFAATMNPDELLTDVAAATTATSATKPSPPPRGNRRRPPPPLPAAAAKKHDDDEEMDMIASHYGDDDDEDDEYGMMMMGGGGPPPQPQPPPPSPPPEYDFDGAAAPSSAGAGTGTGAAGAQGRPGSSDSDVIEISTVYRAAPPAGMVPSGGGTRHDASRSSSVPATAAGEGRNGTLDSYFSRAGGQQQAPPAAASRDAEGGILAYATGTAAAAAAAASASSASSSLSRLEWPSRDDRNATYMKSLASDNFPWSHQMAHHLRHTFRIQSFRDNQKEIINCTMSGDDAFVIMRTGGGKSLTYQLPALLEGRGQQRKVTLVISPLKSLIRDQEDQMNAFTPNSAVSFISGMGTQEHAQRWAQVRDPNAGICLILCTPEKITKSNKLRSELEKLNNAGRLGRFVVDEAHCCCQWGHDFRPDYTKLGILKTHFPSIPLIAVTATASERVRNDCARILRVGTNYQLFRSTANRPNLIYSVRIKPDGSQKVIDDMIEFIRMKHSNDAGIIYTFSKKEAEDVADKLCSGGIVARPYHADVQQAHKDTTHRSWMRNETQVVVATIAFGLGINKPDVRFVLHHSLSKSLEGYYQESGRAGRDGLSADCVLYYSTKDVYRTLGMIHGSHGEGGFWNMMRYAQAFGDSVLCKNIILNMLGEPGSEDLVTILKRGCDLTEPREVGAHAKVAASLLWQSSDDMTAAQMVTLWRSKNAPDCVKAHPPGTDLNKDECDRLIVALMLERVFLPKVVFNAYGSNVYIQLSPKGEQLMRSPNPQVIVRLPKRKAKASKKSSSSKKKAAAKNTASPAQADSSGWIRSSEKKRRKSGGSKAKKKSSGRKTSTSKKKSDRDDDDVIVLSSSDEENEKKGAGNSKKRPARSVKAAANKKTKKDLFDDSSSSSDSEYEFD